MGRKTSKSRFIVIEREMIQSKAFRSLTKTATDVLLIFLKKRQVMKTGRAAKEKWIITNNGQIRFTYTEAEKKYGFKRNTFQRALDKLIETGFLSVSRLGGQDKGNPSLYSLDERWRHYGTPQFVKAKRPKEKIKRGYRKGKRTPPLRLIMS